MNKFNEHNKDQVELECHYVAKENSTITRISGEADSNVQTLMLGMLVEANESHPDGFLRIRVIDANDGQVWRKTDWRCHSNFLIRVSPIVWQYLTAVPVPMTRVQLASNSKFCEDVSNLKVGSKVFYQPPKSTAKYKAVIKSIGAVPDIGPGFYFGLELLEKPAGFQMSAPAEKFLAGSGINGVVANLSNVTPVKFGEIETTNKKKLKQDIDASSSKQLDKFRNNTVKNNYPTNSGRIHQESSSVGKELLVNTDDSNNNNGDPIGQLNEALIPKIVHQSTKSKILSNDVASLSKGIGTTDYFPLDDLLDKEKGSLVARKENGLSLQIGNAVEVVLGMDNRYGVIRWIGNMPGLTSGKTMAAIELEDGTHPDGTDGSYNGIKYFQCPPKTGIFVDIKRCHPLNVMPKTEDHLMKMNGVDLDKTENAVITGMVRPICIKGDLEKICGKYRGIQGHHNSCYLDATLFSMFAFTSVFDNLLFRPANEKDCPQYEEVQRVLREEIVNPLRKNMFVQANRVMKLRTLLEKLSSISGLTSEEKDPEEFLTSLVAQILNAEPFLKLSSGQEAYHYQLFVEKDDELKMPSVQQLLEQSFLTSNIRLKEVPSCLIIQMPRFGKSFKMYPKIQPTLLLDVTDIIEDSPRHCTVCGKMAKFECKECYGQCGIGLESIAFCSPCLDKAHQHERRTNHEPKPLSVPQEFTILQEHCPVPRLFLELSAVVCIETSHYVSFVKCGSGSEAPWCFFDSMADRKGEQNGYNIPEMVSCPDFTYYLSDEGANHLTKLTDDRKLPEDVKRLLCDAYMCMYQSPDVMMYK